MAGEFDPDRYLARLGYRGPREPTLAVLHELTRAHAQTIPFENVDVLLGRPISLDRDALYEKLVTAGRGGYCFELNGGFMALLEALGYRVTPLGGRVRLGTPDRRILPQRTHMLLSVALEGQTWLTDVGTGAASLTGALRLEHGREQRTPHGLRRLVHEEGRWFHQMRRAEAWVDIYEFTLDPMPLVDRVVANWYTSTHPDSHFRTHLIAARALPDGGQVILSDDRLKFRRPGEDDEERGLCTPAAIVAALRREFGIDLPVEAQGLARDIAHSVPISSRPTRSSTHPSLSGEHA